MESDKADSGDSVNLRIIGHVRTPFVEAKGTPIQSIYARDIEGQVLIGCGSAGTTAFFLTPKGSSEG